MPIVEIALLIKVGGAIGWLQTILIVIGTAILGSFMLRQQGLATLMKARQRLDSGQVPAEQMLEGLMLVFGGALLLTPGFVTDTVGFLCLIPQTRQLLATWVRRRGLIAVAGGTASGRPGTSESAEYRSRPGPRRQTGDQPDIIDGEFRRED